MLDFLNFIYKLMRWKITTFVKMATFEDYLIFFCQFSIVILSIVLFYLLFFSKKNK